MKKASVLVLAALALSLEVIAESPDKAKSAPFDYDTLLKVLPRSTTCVIAGNPAKIEIKIMDEIIVMTLEKSRIDPRKDIHAVMMGLTGPPIGKGGEAVFLVDLTFQKDLLLANVKERVKGISEADHNGTLIYKFPGKDAVAAAFLGDSTVVIGDQDLIKPMIDVRRLRSDSVLTDPEMKKVLKNVDRSKAIWGAVRFPPGTVAKAAGDEPALKILEGTTALTMFLDIVDLPDGSGDIILEFRFLGGGAGHNQRLAENLNILKGICLALAPSDSTLFEMLSSFDVLPGKDNVALRAKLSGKSFVSRVLDFVSDFAAIKKIGPKAVEILRGTALKY